MDTMDGLFSGRDRNKMLEIITSIPFVKDDNYEKSYQDGLNADKWIDVDDELPKEHQSVLVYCPCRKNIYCAYLEKDQWWIFGAYKEQITEIVTKWKSLPKISNKENL